MIGIITKGSIGISAVSAVLAVCHLTAHTYVSVERFVIRETGAIVSDQLDSAAHRLGYERPKPPLPELDREALVERASIRRGLNPAYARALLHVESRNDADAISDKGAIGLLQVMPENLKRCGLKRKIDLLDEEKNIECGVQILDEEMKTYKDDVVKAIWAYNGGPNAVKVILRCGVENRSCMGGYTQSVDHSRKVLKQLARDIRG